MGECRSDLRELLRASTPGAYEGLLRIRTVTDRDGALSAGFKAVLMAVTGATQRDPAFADRELSRAAELGVRAERIWATAALVLSSRGEAAYERFVEPAWRLFEPPGPAGQFNQGSRPSDEIDHAQSYLSARTGSLPDYARPLRLVPDALIGYAKLLESTWSSDVLSPAEVQLILMCINVVAIRSDFASHHSRLARAAGATDDAVIEAGVCAIPCGGVTAWYGTGATLLS